MDATIRKVLKRDKLLKGHQWAMLSRGYYLAGSAVMPFETGAEQSELLQQKSKEKDKSMFQEWPLV